MGGGNNKNDYYEVLGLSKECSEAELKSAYKKLALKWHPDRCSSASGNFKYVEESKKKFQAIQEAYSVLSDVDKRFLYDVGVYDTDDDDNEGMAEFMSEMAMMMSQNKPSNGTGESFEELKDLFEEMFESDIDDSSGSTSQSQTRTTSNYSYSSSLFSTCGDQGSSSSTTTSNKRGSSAISNTTKIDHDFQGLASLGVKYRWWKI